MTAVRMLAFAVMQFAAAGLRLAQGTEGEAPDAGAEAHNDRTPGRAAERARIVTAHAPGLRFKIDI